MTFLNQIAIIPAIFIIVAGMLTLLGDDKEKAARRFFLFLLVIGGLLLLAIFVSRQLSPEQFNQSARQITYLLAPSILGVLALILLNLKRLTGMSRGTKIISLLLGLVLVTLFGLIWDPQLGLEFLILPGVLVLAVGWTLGSRYGWLAGVLSLILLGSLFLFNQFMQNPPTGKPSIWLAIPVGLAFYVTPALTVVLAAVLLTTGLQQAPTGTESDTPSDHSPRTMILRIGLAVILLGYLAYTILWGSIWDQTSDGLFGVMVAQQAGIVAIGAGMVMAVVLPGKRRIAGLLFALVVPLLMFQSFEIGWQVSYHEMTERRATRIARALDRFQAREGYYPETLQALTPRDLLFVQQPVILAGENWCYQGGDDHYRLAAFSREFFSAPVSLQVYAAAGQPPAAAWECEEQLAEMKERYYSPMEDPQAMQPPPPTPLADIEVSIPKKELQPLLDGAIAAAGSWSPDSAFFLFGTQAGSSMTLHFLERETGEICSAEGQFSMIPVLRQHHAWLPDGRLLYLDQSGEMVVLTPCRSGSERLTDRFPETFTQIGAYEGENGRILLKSESAYWILDGRSLSLQQITEVAPNPYEFHWDNFAWLPGGERLAISRLDGRDSTEGSTLYIISGDSGAVEKSFSLEFASDQSAPNLEWLTDHELLARSSGVLAVLDLSGDSLKITQVLADIFGLDIDYPNELSADASIVDEDGRGYYLAVRVNHPRNQALYLYQSESDRVDVFDHEQHTLLLFPDRQFEEMPKYETEPTYQDEYDLLLVDSLEQEQPRLVFPGHVPRNYPHLSIKYLAETSQLAVASSQGVSLVSFPDGELVNYWELAGDGFAPFLIASPDGSALVAIRDSGGLYLLLR